MDARALKRRLDNNEPGALAELLGALKRRKTAGGACAALADLMKEPGLSRRIADAPGALPALVMAAKQEGSAATACVALGNMAEAGLARRVADEPGALAALVRAARQGDSACSACNALSAVATRMNRDLARRVADEPGALAALVWAARHGDADDIPCTASNACDALGEIVEAAPDLARRVGGEPGAVAAMAWVAKSRIFAYSACDVLAAIAKAGGEPGAAAIDALLAVVAGCNAVEPEAAAHARNILAEPPLSFSEAALATAVRQAAELAKMRALPAKMCAAVFDLAAAVRSGAPGAS